MLQIRSLSSKEEQEIKNLLSMDLKTLYREFGQEVGTLAPGEDAESQAKKWINARKRELYNLICVQGDYCAFIVNHRNAKIVEIVAAVGDLLATVHGLLPVNTLSVLLVKTSLDEMCLCN